MDRQFAHRIETDEIFFKHARGPSVQSGREFHEHHEIILFLGGEAELISEGLRGPVAPNTLIVIPSRTYHQLLIHGDPQAYHRCLLHFTDAQLPHPRLREGMQALRLFRADDKLSWLFGILTEQARTGDDSAGFLLPAVLALLLSQIADRPPADLQENLQNTLIRSAVAFIDRNLSGKLTVEEVARACSTSQSSLAHAFCREMRMPLHRYILQKRLITAHHLLTAGEPATSVAFRCGFSDYSGFYKQYKKTFGVSPSQKITPDPWRNVR